MIINLASPRLYDLEEFSPEDMTRRMRLHRHPCPSQTRRFLLSAADIQISVWSRKIFPQSRRPSFFLSPSMSAQPCSTMAKHTVSPTLNLLRRTLPEGRPKKSQITSFKAGWELPPRTTIFRTMAHQLNAPRKLRIFEMSVVTCERAISVSGGAR